MPRLIDAEAEEQIELQDLVDILETGNFDPSDEDNFASFGPALKKLANNRGFLAEIILQELKDRCSGQLRNNQYSPQVILLYGPSGKYMLRANIWPGSEDSVVRHSGIDPFFYGVPHDHNFSFLTVGYLGPGYWSDYYEYDYATVAGFSGESVDLRFVERSRLDAGKVMLYRIHRDVHLQLPADSMSVSLNILEVSNATQLRDQYRFDVERSRIDGILTRTAIEPMLTLAAHFGGGEGQDLLHSFAAGHPSDRIRFSALKAQAAALTDTDARIELYERAARSGHPFISTMATAEARKAEATRLWFANAPSLEP